MKYVLELQLAGDANVKSALAGVKESVRQIGTSPGSVFNVSNSSPTAKILSDLDKASHRVAGMKKDFQSIATSMAQGMGGGGAWLATAFGSKSSSFQALNPHLAGVMQGLVQQGLPWRRYDMANRFRTGLMSWALPGGFSSLPHVGTIQGLRDVTGSDLAKVAGMGAFGSWNSIKGLRDVTGADLAKVAALGQFGSWDRYKGPPPPVLGSGAGNYGLSGAPFIGQYLSVIGAATGALLLFRRAIQLASDSVSRGYGIYTGAAASGVTPGLYSYRSSLANIFGVQGNQNQVFMFGNAVKQVSERIAQSTRTLAQNSPALAQVAMNAKILKIDFEALASDITTKFAPAINLIMAGLDATIKLFDMLANSKFFKVVAAMGFNWIAGGIAPFGVGKGSLLENAIKQFSQPLPQMLPMLMKQMPGSQWESMGLSIGPNIGNEIVSQIKKSNSYLKVLPAIANHIGVNNGVPRGGTFGMNVLVNNP